MVPFLVLQMHTVSAFLDLPEHLVSLLAHFLPCIMNVCICLWKKAHNVSVWAGCARNPPLPRPSGALPMTYHTRISVCWVQLNTLALGSVTEDCFSQVSLCTSCVPIPAIVCPNYSLFPSGLQLQYFLIYLPIQKQNDCFIHQWVKKIKSLLTGKPMVFPGHWSICVMGSIFIDSCSSWEQFSRVSVGELESFPK